MPYIKQTRRGDLDLAMILLMQEKELTNGDLNYIITRLLHNQLKLHGTNYERLNGLTGVLECAKLELYRRVVSPYEDLKISENGDV